jgi:hypothetical protein
MPAPKAFAWIKPWMVVAALTTVAAGGATAVYYAGESQHRRDRADIVRWEARALPAATEAATVRASLTTSMPAAAIANARSTLQRDLAAIVSPPLPEIVRPAAAAYESAISKTLAALNAIGSPGFSLASQGASAAFEQAARTEQTLVCRARLPVCREP